jgi:hypothetical protein
LLPGVVRESLYNDKDEVACQYFCREGMSVCRPYLTWAMRERYEEIKVRKVVRAFQSMVFILMALLFILTFI